MSEPITPIGITSEPLQDIDQGGDLIDVDPNGATQVDVFEALQPSPVKKRKKHRPMNKEEQIDAVRLFNTTLAIFCFPISVTDDFLGELIGATAQSFR